MIMINDMIITGIHTDSLLIDDLSLLLVLLKSPLISSLESPSPQ